MFKRPELERLSRVVAASLVNELVAELERELAAIPRWRILRRVQQEQALELARFAQFAWYRGRASATLPSRLVSRVRAPNAEPSSGVDELLRRARKN